MGRTGAPGVAVAAGWVSVGAVPVKNVAALSPLASDVVITGHDREEVGVLVFPSPAANALPADELAEKIRAGLQAMRAEGGGSSQAPSRALLLNEPPSVDAGEITDKGYLNQRAVLTRRAAQVLALYSSVPNPAVIRL